MLQRPSQKRTTHLSFVGTIEETDSSTVIVNYLNRKGDLFYFPEKVDRLFITVLDVVTELTATRNEPDTSRTVAKFYLNFFFVWNSYLDVYFKMTVQCD